MRVLHYALGLASQRGGGLTRYADDLAKGQARMGDKVFYMWPGRYVFGEGCQRFICSELQGGVTSIELVNPLPVPMMAGISDVDAYTKSVDPSPFVALLDDIKPDIFHVHSLMGLPKEFLEEARRRGIPVVMTTHDFFGICPTATLYDEPHKRLCPHEHMGDGCALCSVNALSMSIIRLAQSHLYRTLRSTSVITKLRKRADSGFDRSGSSASQAQVQAQQAPGVLPDYARLEAYYRQMFDRVSLFLYNSDQTREIYEAHIGRHYGRTLYLTHEGISDYRRLRTFSDGELDIAYMTSCAAFKGFYLARDAVRELRSEGMNIVLNVYNDDVTPSDGVRRMGSFGVSDQERIFAENALTAIPSKWYETLSFIALESLSYGVPVAISSTVGAKGLVRDGETGFIFDPDVETLKALLRKIYSDRSMLARMNEAIVRDDVVNYDFPTHVADVLICYQSVMG